MTFLTSLSLFEGLVFNHRLLICLVFIFNGVIYFILSLLQTKWFDHDQQRKRGIVMRIR